MNKEIINSNKAPAPIGPYNQAIRCGDMLFVSGQVAIDVNSGEMINGTIEDEAERVMKNLEAILIEAGLTFGHVIKTTIFLTSMEFFAQVNEVYGRHMTTPFPARETVAVVGLPKGAKVEISVIATF